MTASAQAVRHVRLHVTADGLDEQLTLTLDRPLSLGRDPECDVLLPSVRVSRKHVSLFEAGGRLSVRDHSSNGTRVNGEQLHLADRELGSTGRLEVGPYLVRVQLVEVPEGVSQGQPSGELVGLRRRIRARLLDDLDLVALGHEQMTPERMRPEVLEALERIMESLASDLPSGAARTGLRDELCDEVLGLGPLEPLLRDSSVSEIMLIDAATIYVERGGRVERTAAHFTDDTAVRAALERIVTPLGRRIDESSPIVDARLRDGSRVNAVIPPLALRGPCITIRKFPSQRLTLARLVELGSLSEPMARFLGRAVRVRVNIVISGGTGSGKTTLLNVLSSAIPEHERVVTIEDAAELALAQPHVVSLEARPPNMEGVGAITIRALVKNALRMRPDRIVVGECRGGEALDMLQAMNTGHDGSMTTTHANSPAEAVQRLETLCLMAGLDLPLAAIRRQIAASVELLVQQARFADGSRRVTRIAEIVGMDERGEVELRELFRYEQSGTCPGGEIEGEFLATGSIPRCVGRFVTAGLLEGGQCF